MWMMHNTRINPAFVQLWAHLMALSLSNNQLSPPNGERQGIEKLQFPIPIDSRWLQIYSQVSDRVNELNK